MFSSYSPYFRLAHHHTYAWTTFIKADNLWRPLADLFLNPKVPRRPLADRLKSKS